MRRPGKTSLKLFLVLLIFTFTLLPVSSQDASIEFTGEITALSDNNIIVNGLNVQIDMAEIHGTLLVGELVHVEGTLQADGVIVAREIRVLAEATPEPEATPEVTPDVSPDINIDIDNNVVIVIEGPVQEVNVNIITIYDIDIVVADNDPLLTVINIGDHIRVEGVIDDDFDMVDMDDDGDSNLTIVVIAINITFIDIDIFIGDNDEVWRDNGNCANPPPPWAPANGWRRRCENGGRGGSGSGSRSGRGGSRS